MSQSQAVNPVGLPPPRLRAMVRALRNTSGITTALPTLRTTPPSWSAGSDPASRLKSRWLVAPSAAPSAAGCWWMMSAEVAVARGAERGAIRRGMLVDDVCAECGVHGDGNSPLGGGEQEGDVAGRELGAAREIVGERFAHALAGARAVGDRGVHLAPGLLHHAKRAVRQPGGDVLTRASVCRKLEIVDGRASVERQVGDDTAADELAEQGSQADLDDVPAEHRDDAAAARGLRELPREGAEVLRGEDVREGIPEGGKARIAARRMRQQGGVDFVGALRDGDRFQTGKVRLAVVGHGCSGPEAGFCLAESISLSLRVTWPNENFDCSASMIRRLSSESHMRASAFSAKIPPPLGIRGRTTSASHFFPATPTRARFSTSTITGLRSGRK